MGYLLIVKKDTAFDTKKAFLDVVNFLDVKESVFTFDKELTDYAHKGALYCYEENKYKYVIESRAHFGILDNAFSFDVFTLDNIPDLTRTGALVMDMDMTTVQIEGIDEIARALGKYDEIAALTEKAMQGHMDFNTSLKMRVSLLKDGDANVLNHVKSIMTETEGLSNLINLLKEHSWKIGIASGGFTQLIDVIKDKYNLDMVRANTLEIVDNKFTGNVVGEIVNAQLKKEALESIIATNNIEDSQSICIGDGANDLLMINRAGLGVAYKAKRKVQEQVKCKLNYSDLSAIALLLKIKA